MKMARGSMTTSVLMMGDGIPCTLHPVLMAGDGATGVARRSPCTLHPAPCDGLPPPAGSRVQGAGPACGRMVAGTASRVRWARSAESAATKTTYGAAKQSSEGQ